MKLPKRIFSLPLFVLVSACLCNFHSPSKFERFLNCSCFGSAFSVCLSFSFSLLPSFSFIYISVTLCMSFFVCLSFCLCRSFIFLSSLVLPLLLFSLFYVSLWLYTSHFLFLSVPLCLSMFLSGVLDQAYVDLDEWRGSFAFCCWPRISRKWVGRRPWGRLRRFGSHLSSPYISTASLANGCCGKFMAADWPLVASVHKSPTLRCGQWWWLSRGNAHLLRFWLPSPAADFFRRLATRPGRFVIFLPHSVAIIV